MNGELEPFELAGALRGAGASLGKSTMLFRLRSPLMALRSRRGARPL
jgi:hypothetical protein